MGINSIVESMALVCLNTRGCSGGSGGATIGEILSTVWTEHSRWLDAGNSPGVGAAGFTLQCRDGGKHVLSLRTRNNTYGQF